MVELVKAMATAELEITGRYVEERHDPYFDRFDTSFLSAKDMALFPDYLVVTVGSSAADNAGLLDALAAGLPLKVAVVADDVVEHGAAGNGRFTFGLRGTQLAGMATGLGEAFVLQSTSSNLYQMRDRLQAGLAFQGPALFSIFAGSPAPQAQSRYLTSAAAMQSRAFPAFTYDPSAGDDLASRFSLENNPAVEADWTVDTLDYADDNLQRTSERIAFTFVDFLVADPRFARHFVSVPRAAWTDKMVPAAECLAYVALRRRPAGFRMCGRAMPWGRLERLVCDDKAIAAAHRCLEAWHRLQESGGVHNSHADRLLAREKAAWDEQRRRDESLKVEAASGRAGRFARRRAGPCRRPRGEGGGAFAGRALYRVGPLFELQRVHPAQRQDVRLQRKQAGLHRQCRCRHVPAAGRGGGKIARSASSIRASRATRASPTWTS